MRRIISICMLLGSCLTMLAQATSLVVDNQTPGWLSSKINYGDQITVRNLKVTGYINDADLKFIGTLIHNQALDGNVDLYDANIVGNGKNNYLGQNCFGTSINDKISVFRYPQTLEDAYFPLDGLTIDTVYFNPSIKYAKYELIGRDNCKVNILYFGEKVDSIPENAFYALHYANKLRLKKIFLSPRTRYVGEKAFGSEETSSSMYEYINLNELPNLEYVGKLAFRGYQPDTLILGDKMKTYNTTMVSYKENQHIFVPKTITNVNNTYWGMYYSGFTRLNGDIAWIYGDRKVFFHIDNETPPDIVLGTRENAKERNLSGCTLYVPRGSGSLYRAHEVWGTANIIEKNPIEKITLNKKMVSLDKGGEEQLTVSLTPTDADDITVSWNSKDEDVAVIDQNGKVRAISPGTTWVYATNIPTGVKDSCMVTVIQHVSGISIEPKEVLFSKIGETMQLKAEILPANATDKSVKWTSSNSSVCAVTESGYLIALNDGTAIIVAMTADGNYPATCVVKVDTTTGVEGVQLDKGVMKTINGITVHGKTGEFIRIINSQGVVVYRGVCSGGEEQITLPKGLYIVTIGDKTMKIVL